MSDLRALLLEARTKITMEREQDEDKPLELWFMYDDHTFSRLPLDPDAAAVKIETILKEPNGRYGMLCSKQFKEYVHHDYTTPDKKFIEQTRKWVRDALEFDRAVKIDPSEIPVIPNIDAAILAAVEAGGKFDMSDWHGPDGHWCGTTHCRAGWAIHLAGEKGKALQDKVGPNVAGALIYQASRPGKPVPWFFASTDEAMADIVKCAKEAS